MSLRNIFNKFRIAVFLYDQFWKIIRNIKFISDYRSFSTLHQKQENGFSLKWKDRHKILGEDTADTGFDRHYLYHTAWAARILKKTNPEVHYDISSCLRFVSIASAFIPIQFIDFRPPKIKLDGMNTTHGDITNLKIPDNSITSLSCMHVVEHIGLGRYGDPLDPDGDKKAISELKRVLAKDGNLLFVVPVGKESKIHFNAHRVYSYHTVLEMFSDLKLIEFSLIRMSAGRDEAILYNASDKDLENESYACGCFWFIKK